MICVLLLLFVLGISAQAYAPKQCGQCSDPLGPNNSLVGTQSFCECCDGCLTQRPICIRDHGYCASNCQEYASGFCNNGYSTTIMPTTATTLSLRLSTTTTLGTFTTPTQPVGPTPRATTTTSTSSTTAKTTTKAPTPTTTTTTARSTTSTPRTTTVARTTTTAGTTPAPASITLPGQTAYPSCRFNPAGGPCGCFRSDGVCVTSGPRGDFSYIKKGFIQNNITTLTGTCGDAAGVNGCDSTSDQFTVYKLGATINDKGDYTGYCSATSKMLCCPGAEWGACATAGTFAPTPVSTSGSPTVFVTPPPQESTTESTVIRTTETATTVAGGTTAVPTTVVQSSQTTQTTLDPNDCRNFSFDCKKCLTHPLCRYCPSTSLCTDLSGSAVACNTAFTTDTTQCGIELCAGVGAADQCLFGPNFAVNAQTDTGCIRANTAPIPVRPLNPTACQIAVTTPSCANLIRTLGCSAQCQSCNRTVATTTTVPVCRDFCNSMIATACPGIETACSSAEDPFQFICAPVGSTRCTTIVVPSVMIADIPSATTTGVATTAVGGGDTSTTTTAAVSQTPTETNTSPTTVPVVTSTTAGPAVTSTDTPTSAPTDSTPSTVSTTPPSTQPPSGVTTAATTGGDNIVGKTLSPEDRDLRLGLGIGLPLIAMVIIIGVLCLCQKSPKNDNAGSRA